MDGRSFARHSQLIRRGVVILSARARFARELQLEVEGPVYFSIGLVARSPRAIFSA